MRELVYAGPTISKDEIRKYLPNATVFGPVQCGEICHRALEGSVFSIGIIDGLFQKVPAVFHKEILFALTKGIHVFGAASMGALRASELHSFGMIGVGKICEAFVNGWASDDDEVAIVHADAEFVYKPLSEAMVNIRTCLHKAWEDAAITTRTRDMLIDYAKSLYYPDRTVANIRDKAPHMEKDEVVFYLKGGGKVDQKKLDAIEMLKLMKSYSDQQRAPKPHNFTLEYTDCFDDLVRDCRE